MTTLTIKLVPDAVRRCGDCQLCCKLMPLRDATVHDGYKPANMKCTHQKFGVGCSIYAKRPRSCAVFSCRWLTKHDTADQHRPDRAHCVIDPMPDTLDIANEDGTRDTITVCQIWVDPRYRYAFRDEPMRSFIERRGAEGIATLIRWDERAGLAVFPASITGSQWMERGGIAEEARTPQGTIAAVAASRRLVPPT
jgi:hypothetical protein